MSGKHVKYYLDGQLIADHATDAQGDPVTPQTPTSVHYNLWFIDTVGHTTYTEQVDWTYHAGNEVVSPSDAIANASEHRTAGTAHLDPVSGCAPSK